MVQHDFLIFSAAAAALSAACTCFGLCPPCRAASRGCDVPGPGDVEEH